MEQYRALPIVPFFRDLLSLIYPDINLGQLMVDFEARFIHALTINFASLHSQEEQEDFQKQLEADTFSVDQFMLFLASGLSQQQYQEIVSNTVTSFFNYYYQEIMPKICPDKMPEAKMLLEKYQFNS